jgi:hypothetical protein
MLKRLLAPIAALALLGGCAGLTSAITSGPATVADQTVADERVALGVETMYQGWNTMVTTGVELGLIRGPLAGRLQDYDRRIFAAVQLARQAYDAGNAASYAQATAQASALIAEATALINGGN